MYNLTQIVSLHIYTIGIVALYNMYLYLYNIMIIYKLQKLFLCIVVQKFNIIVYIYSCITIIYHNYVMLHTHENSIHG